MLGCLLLAAVTATAGRFYVDLSSGVTPKHFVRGEWFVSVTIVTGAVWIGLFALGLNTWICAAGAFVIRYTAGVLAMYRGLEKPLAEGPSGVYVHENRPLLGSKMAHGKTWKVYVMEPMPLSFTGMIHFSQLKDRLATHFVPFSEFEKDAAAGTLPDFSLIEPNMAGGHGDYHPAMGRSLSDQLILEIDSPSSMLSGEAFLARVFDAYRSATSETGTNVWNTALLIGWDEPGGTYDHVPPGPVPPPDPSAPSGEFGFAFDRSGYRVPAIMVSPWVEPGSVYNDEYRHTSLIATLRKAWGLGDPFTQRDASARTFDHVLSLATPRDPATWVLVEPRPVPAWTLDVEVVGQALSTLGKGMGISLVAMAKDVGVTVPAELDSPGATLPPSAVVPFLRKMSAHFFPLLGGDR